MMAFMARVSCCVFRVLGFNSNLFNFGPPSPGKLNPTGQTGVECLKHSGYTRVGITFFALFYI